MGIAFYTPTMSIKEGDILWTPTARDLREANLTDYMRWLAQTRGLDFNSYDALWAWSVNDADAFWRSICEYFGVIFHAPPATTLSVRVPCPPRVGLRAQP